MLTYYLRLAAKSIIATPVVSLLTVLAIGLGIAVPAAMMSIHHLAAQNPIPHKSDRLFNVRMDSWDPESEFFDILPGDPPKHITYRDMAGIIDSEIPVRRTGIGSARVFVFPGGDEGDGGADDGRAGFVHRPFEAGVRLCHADFFGLVEAPFRFGGGWSREDDELRRRVVVLSHESNQRLFGGNDSVGRRLRVGNGEVTVVGVLGPFRPTPQYYDVINNALGETREIFLPFDLIREQDLGLVRIGDTDSWGSFDGNDDPDAFFTASETCWIQYWVELEPASVEPYRQAIDAYTLEQKALGRFPRPINNRVSSLMEWMKVRGVVSQEIVAMSIISVLFLAVCIINLTGLLLGKLLARSSLVGIHRALGASRLSVFMQCLLECELIGIAGGAVGVVLAGAGLAAIDRTIPAWVLPDQTIQVDGFTLLVSAALAVLAGLLCGIYPAWRACRIAPAVQLKIQ